MCSRCSSHGQDPITLGAETTGNFGSGVYAFNLALVVLCCLVQGIRCVGLTKVCI